MVRGMEISLWALLIAASFTDISRNRIPNRLTLPLLMLGFVFQIALHGMQGFARAGLSVGAAFALYFPLFASRVFAAGDVKLLMAAGSFLEVRETVCLGLVAIVVGAVVGLTIMVALRGAPLAVHQIRGYLSLRRSELAPTRVPFAPAILCGLMLMKIAEVLQWF